MNLQHPAVIESGPNWVRFKAAGPDTLDEIVDVQHVIERLTNEGQSVWFAQWEDEVETPRIGS